MYAGQPTLFVIRLKHDMIPITLVLSKKWGLNQRLWAEYKYYFGSAALLENVTIRRCTVHPRYMLFSLLISHALLLVTSA